MQLDGKRVIVTGGSSGIGKAAVLVCVREGARVASLDVDDEAGVRVVEAANDEHPGRAFYHHCDVSQRDEVRLAFESAVDDLGGLDALVHIAGIESQVPAESMTDEEWNIVLDVNLKGTFLTNQAAFPYLRENGGRIINTTSRLALAAEPSRCHYAASKGGVASWSRALAAEWGPYGINVVVLSPVARTAMTDRYRATLSSEDLAEYDARMAANNLLGRAGDPETDVAPVIAFLVSDAARFITAQIIGVDGGAQPLR
jgi:NAD(P)-dependent dehydrogenase (short-subunit alcohol dehydrogenase family)